MRALDVYKAILKELDKVESPSFSIPDFNYFIMSAFRQYVSNNYIEGDIVQKNVDDLGSLVRYDIALDRLKDEETGDPLEPNKFFLPEDYRHLWELVVELEFLEDDGIRKAKDVITVYPKRMRSNRRGFQQGNAYQQHSWEYPVYRIEDTKVRIFAGDKVKSNTALMTYIITEPLIYLGPEGSDYASETENTTISVPDYVMQEIIKVCTRLFLENITSPRYQSALQEQQLRAE